MATKNNPQVPPVGEPTLAPSQALVFLQQERAAGEALIAKGGPTWDELSAWRSRTQHRLEQAFGQNSDKVWKVVNAGPSLMLAVRATESELRQHRIGSLTSKLSQLSAMIDLVQGDVATSSTEAPREDRSLVRVARILERFHVVARQLRRRHGARASLEIGDEYDVQDLLHALLRVDFEDVRSEENVPSYAGGNSRIDFLLKGTGIVIEVKMARKTLGAKEVGEELLVDIARYRSHPDCRTLVCFVYDPEGIVKNPAGLEADLSRRHEALEVRVVIRPRE